MSDEKAAAHAEFEAAIRHLHASEAAFKAAQQRVAEAIRRMGDLAMTSEDLAQATRAP